METVYAYRDNGWMQALSRWKPRRVFCTNEPNHSDEPGVEHVVKFRQGAAGAAALISEVVCGQLLAAVGIEALDQRLVVVSPEFAASYRTKSEIPYKVVEGLHFATVRRHDVVSGPPLRLVRVTEPQQLIDLWAFDSWVCTIDRVTEGNILLTPADKGKYRLIAADQSDCFGGSGCFANGSWIKILKERGAAETVDFLDQAIFAAGGARPIREAIARLQRAGGFLDAAIACVPAEWWHEGGIRAADVKSALTSRLRKMSQILDLKKWGGLNDAIKGGHHLF